MSENGFIWFFKNIWAIRSIIIVIVALVAPCYLLIDGDVKFRCAYALIVMAILWLTECIPIPTTALLPIFMFPLLGVQPARLVCSNYVNETSMLFLGGLIVAIAVEEVGLHRRIALGIVKLLGTQTNFLMLGLMLPTWFLSMWISNTAATSMMVPIITAVTSSVGLDNDKKGEDNPAFEMKEKTVEITEPTKENGEVKKSNENGASVDDIDIGVDPESVLNLPEPKKGKELSRIGKGLALSVAYGANIGGIATLTGTPPNLILQGAANKIYNQKKRGTESGITFANWMGFAFPLSLITLVLAWFWLQLAFLGCSCFKKTDKEKRKAMDEAINKKYKELGSISFGEVVVIVMFIILAMLWIFRDIPGLGGWRFLFLVDKDYGPYARDSTPSVLIAVLFFFLPSRLPNIFCWNKRLDDGTREKPTYSPILNWEVTARKLPWGVIILLGGGFALADASGSSGLSKWVGTKLTVFSDFEPWVMNLILSIIVALATEVTSNSATATLLMPVMAELSITVGVHPLYLMISACIASSFAFMLPVATPPNAIVFSTGYVRIPDMASVGLLMNGIAVLVLTLGINTWGKYIYNLDTIPDIFLPNTTTTTMLPNTTTLYPNTTTLFTNMTTVLSDTTNVTDLMTTLLPNITTDIVSNTTV